MPWRTPASVADKPLLPLRESKLRVASSFVRREGFTLHYRQSKIANLKSQIV